MRQYYSKEGKAETPLRHPWCVSKRWFPHVAEQVIERRCAPTRWPVRAALLRRSGSVGWLAENPAAASLKLARCLILQAVIRSTPGISDEQSRKTSPVQLVADGLLHPS
jgi:hypothetical protein